MTVVTKQLTSSLPPQTYISQVPEQGGILHHEAAIIQRQTQTHLRAELLCSFQWIYIYIFASLQDSS